MRLYDLLATIIGRINRTAAFACIYKTDGTGWDEICAPAFRFGYAVKSFDITLPNAWKSWGSAYYQTMSNIKGPTNMTSVKGMTVAVESSDGGVWATYQKCTSAQNLPPIYAVRPNNTTSMTVRLTITLIGEIE